MTAQRVIDVRKQETLSLAKSLHLCLSGISHRLVRSMLTLSVVLLAVAFFMALLSENAFLRSTADGVTAEIAVQREAVRFLNRLYTQPSSLQHSKTLAAAWGDTNALREVASVTGWDLGRVDRLAESCHWEQTYYRFFKGMDVGKRLILIEKNEDRAIFRFLRDPEQWQEFLDRMEPLRSLKLPGDEGPFRAFLDHFDGFENEIRALAKRWNDQVAALSEETRTLTNGKAVDAWLCTTDDAGRKRWQEIVRARGFALDDAKLARVYEQLRTIRLRQEVATELNTREKRSEWQKTFFEKPTLEHKMVRLDNKKVVALLNNRYTPEQLAQISRNLSYERRLAELEKVLAVRTEAKTGGILSGRQLFLLLISFLVCMVGISNAMLMAITERFREIATMKCLGATDGFILTQFMLEAGLQGIIGGLVGMVIGLALALLKGSVTLGTHLYRYLPWGDLVGCAAIAIGAGVVLSVFASVYPSWSASRMAPMEAMRVE